MASKTNRSKSKIARGKRKEELPDAAEILEQVFSKIVFPIAYMDPEFNLIRVNEAFAQVTGRTPESFIGKNFFALFMNEELKAIFRQVAETEEAFTTFDRPFWSKDNLEQGAMYYWDLTLQPVSEKGRVTALLLTAIDRSARRQAQKMVVEKEEFLRKLIELLPVGVWVADRNGVITYGNPVGHRIWGGSRYVGLEGFGEYKGRWLHSGERIKPEEWALARAVAKGEVSYGEEVEIECFDGTRKIIVNSALPIRNDQEEIIGAIAVNDDITERKRIEKGIRNMQKMEALGILAGGIAHDLNNILMPILMNTDLALLDTPKESPLSNYLKLVQEAANRGKDLVKQIVSFSRQEEDTRAPVEIGPILKDALRLLRSSVPSNIDIRERIHTDSGIIMANPTQIHQILMNLCSNASDAMKEKGGVLDISISEVEVDAHMAERYPELSPGPHVRLSVADTGCGVEQSAMERIFDPFFTTKSPGQGTGMGLTLVHSIVKNHGGAITAYSEVGKGTTFNIFLPMVRTSKKTESPPSESLPAGREKILLIDDEEIQVRSVQPALERFGYQVIGMSDSVKAFDLFKNRPDEFDLIVTDQRMPGLTGRELARKVLDIRPDFPIILCTGFSEAVHEQEAKAIGIRECIMKPVSMKEMLETIRKALSR